jgi:hypothetical protein
MAQTFVPLRSADDTRQRYVCRLPASALETLRNYASMIEELETKAGRPPHRRRRSDSSGPEPATMDYCTAYAISNLAKDRKFVDWMQQRRVIGSGNGTPPPEPTHDESEPEHAEP